MQRTDFHFDLPQELIAQRPAAERSGVAAVELSTVCQDPAATCSFAISRRCSSPEDLLVFNDTRVIPARVFGTKASGGRVEILLERALTANTALAHVRASKGLRDGAIGAPRGRPKCAHVGQGGGTVSPGIFLRCTRVFCKPRRDSAAALHRPPRGARRTANAIRPSMRAAPGAIAAPTAGLHFDAAIFAALRIEARAACLRHPARRCRHLCAGAQRRHRSAIRCMRSTWRCPRPHAPRSTRRAPRAGA